MQLADLRGTYDAIFSLGQNCTPSIQLEKNKLRPFAGVFDWMMSDSLAMVNFLLHTRFAGFMELSNLRVTGAGQHSLLVEDQFTKVVSVHDFPLSKNSSGQLDSYPEFKDKLNRRITRFYDKAAGSKRVLFVRMLGSYEEAQELQTVLSGIVKGDFHVLLVNYSQVPGIVDNQWPLEHVCAVDVPYADIWNFNSDHHWQALFRGISVG